MARLRKLAEWEALTGDEALTNAERALMDSCRSGARLTIGDGSRPNGPDPERNVRADLLRYLILGGCENCPTSDEGVHIVGAYVTGLLDVSFAEATGATGFFRVRTH